MGDIIGRTARTGDASPVSPAVATPLASSGEHLGGGHDELTKLRQRRCHWLHLNVSENAADDVVPGLAELQGGVDQRTLAIHLNNHHVLPSDILHCYCCY